eukprot:TRINITY_DN1276_c0_g1_i2.p1 TRINITY_DN1276_c0_g1~~TRINITY_DN1276_c0_g1_i2.p1  ORF type:complete len:618 (+),score=120.01 TRINITY_DN1276_c0_g1_i2:531-2384(+)
MVVEVLQDASSCSSSSGDVVCPFGVLFLGEGACPSYQSYLMKQTFSKRGILYSHEPSTSKQYVVAVASDMFSAQFDTNTEQRNRLGDVPLSIAACCDQAWNYTISVKFEDNSNKITESVIFVVVLFCVPMILTLMYKFLQLTKTITWDDDDCTCAPDVDEEAKMVGISDAEFVPQPTDVHQEGKVVAVDVRNRMSPKLKRMPTLCIISDDRIEDAKKNYDKHRSYEKTKFYWIGAVAGICMMIPAWAYALTLLERDKSEQTTCHFNNTCRADIKFLGSVNIPQFGSILTNITYILCSIFFALYVSMDNRTIRSKTRYRFSLRNDMNLFYAMSIGMFFLGIFSSIYHTCPNLINYQFDLVFMHFTVLIIVVALYRRRHILHALHVGNYYFIFMSFVLIQALGMFFLVNGAVKYFWAVIGFVYMIALVLIVLRLIFFTSESWKELLLQMRELYDFFCGPTLSPAGSPSLNKLDSSDPIVSKLLVDRYRVVLMVVLLIEEVVIFAFSVKWSVIPSDWVLGSLALPGFTYVLYYVLRKVIAREGIPWKSAVFITLAIAFAVIIFSFPEETLLNYQTNCYFRFLLYFFSRHTSTIEHLQSKFREPSMETVFFLVLITMIFGI